MYTENQYTLTRGRTYHSSHGTARYRIRYVKAAPCRAVPDRTRGKRIFRLFTISNFRLSAFFGHGLASAYMPLQPTKEHLHRETVNCDLNL